MTIEYKDSKRIVATSEDVAVVSNRGTIDTTSSAGNTIITFTGDGTFTPTSEFNVETIVVAGGGGGGSGGGGAGGIVYDAVKAVTAKNYDITVGAGGTAGWDAGNGGQGEDSVFDNITSLGGGAGMRDNNNGSAGGSGAGGSATSINVGAGGASTQTASGGDTGYGNAGGSSSNSSPYPSSGGGGAGATGGNGSGSVCGSGGIGIVNPISGSTTGESSGGSYYLGGGGGGGRSGATQGTGGTGGGGNGSGSTTGEAGTANTGGGGGGSYGSSGTGVGGSGVVIIKFATSGNTYSTSAGGKPTDVQDNSILVEKDTARRYWFTPQTVDTEEAFSFTTTDTVNALWGNRIYGMKLLSGHSGLNKYIKKIKTYHPTNPTGSRLTTGTLYHVILDSSGTEIARSAGVSASSVSNNSWAETTLSTPVKLEENYTVGVTISTGSGSSYLGTAVNNNGSSPTNTTRYYKDESGNVGLSTSETMLMVFDSDPATGLSIPATWTMNPTIEDDLTTNNGWVFPTNSSYDSTNDQIDLTIASSSFDVSYIDLQKAVYFGSGNNLDDDKFIIRARITKNNNLSDTSKGSSLLLQVSSALTDSAKSPNPQDAVGIRIDTNRTGGANYFYVHSTDNGTFWDGESSGIAYDWQTGDLYWEIIGDGTNVTGELFTGSDYSTGSLGKATTSQQSPTGMRYLKFCGFNDPSRTATQFSLQDFIIYNGVTTPN